MKLTVEYNSGCRSEHDYAEQREADGRAPACRLTEQPSDHQHARDDDKTCKIKRCF